MHHNYIAKGHSTCKEGYIGPLNMSTIEASFDLVSGFSFSARRSFSKLIVVELLDSRADIRIVGPSHFRVLFGPLLNPDQMSYSELLPMTSLNVD